MKKFEDYLSSWLATRKSINVMIDCPVHGNTPCYLNQECVMCAEAKFKIMTTRRRESLVDRKTEAGIRKLYLDSTFVNYKVENSEQQVVHSTLSTYEYGKSIVLHGGVGTGKTHLACALVDKMLQLDFSCYYVKYFNLASIQIEEKKLYKSIVSRDFLVIDEFGRSDSDYKTCLLFEIIERRCDDLLPTMIVSNLDTATIRHALGDALYSRVKRSCIAFKTSWEDYRLK